MTEQPCGGCLDVPWECGSPPQARVPQGPLPLLTDLPASASQPRVTLSLQAAGNTIVLGSRKGSPREWVFRTLSHIQCVDHQTPGLRACSQGLKSRVRPSVCLHSVNLANTFLGQCSPAHGEGGSMSAFEGTECHAWFTWPRAPGTSHGPPARRDGPAPGVPSAGAGSKASSARRSKQPQEAFGSRCWATPHQGSPGEKCQLGSLGLGSRWVPRVLRNAKECSSSVQCSRLFMSDSLR